MLLETDKIRGGEAPSIRAGLAIAREAHALVEVNQARPYRCRTTTNERTRCRHIENT
jgi:hypothetical protein